MLGVIAANEAITFLIFWEIMSVSSYFLVVHEANKKGILKD
jgi:hydrogenase-4 component B